MAKIDNGGLPDPFDDLPGESLAGWLDDEAEQHEEYGDAYNALIAKILRRAAAAARETGAVRPADLRLEAFFGADGAADPAAQR